MKMQFEIKRKKETIFSGTIKDVMHNWDLLIGQDTPKTQVEQRLVNLYSNKELALNLSIL